MPKTMEELRGKILEAAEKIPRDEVVRSMLNLRKRAGRIIERNGQNLK